MTTEIAFDPEKVKRYDWNTGVFKFNGEHVHFDDYAKLLALYRAASLPRETEGADRWIEIKDGCPMPKYGQAVRVIHAEAYQEVAVYRGAPSVGKWSTHHGKDLHEVSYWKHLDWPIALRSPQGGKE